MQDYAFLKSYFENAAAREAQGVEPLPVTADEARELTSLLVNPPEGADAVLLHLLKDRIPPGVDEAAKVKAEFLAEIAMGRQSSPLVSPEEAVNLLGTMKGGYNVAPLISLLSSPALAKAAREALTHTLMVYDAFDGVAKLCEAGNTEAQALMQAWADGTWFTSRESLPDTVTLKVFRVTGEINTDDLSPATDAWSRPDIPLHAMAMFKNAREGLTPDEEGVRGPITLINSLKEEGYPLVFVGDVVGTGSSRKSATNSVLWHMGRDIEGVPNKREGGFVFGGKIAPIFYNTLEDSGALPLEMDVSSFKMGDVIDLKVAEGKVCRHGSDEVLATFSLKTQALLDEVRAGGRISLIIGRALTNKARAFLKEGPSSLFAPAPEVKAEGGFTRAQKIIGMNCGKAGVRPGEYVEVKVATVGSQDTTGPMTRDELKDLACLKFAAPLVMQSFCHTAAYPRPVDIKTHQTLPRFFEERGGVALRPGDGVIHCFLNRMCLPNTLGTGGDSHTRMPLGISFAAGSGLVAFAAATGTMPLDVPESVLVRFKGKMRPGITLRDLVHAIPYYAIRQGLLTVEKKGKKNIFSGRILEIEGLEDLEVEHAFELCDASAERAAAACAVHLNKDKVVKYLRSNAAFLRQMAAEGYESREALLRRAATMDECIENYQDVMADEDARYAAVIEIDVSEITEPIICVPNDPDDVHLLSDFAGRKIDEVFVGSCMTNIGHYRAAATVLSQAASEVPARLWMAPPTRMDRRELMDEGLYSTFIKAGARMEIPGCSLCMGNQARVRDNATVVSTSTRNFPNRLGKGAQVFLASAELASVCALLGKMPTPSEYFESVQGLKGKEASLYRLLDFATV